MTFSNVFLITNVTTHEENVWDADNDVLKSKFDDAYNTIVHWRKSRYLLPSNVLLKK